MAASAPGPAPGPAASAPSAALVAKLSPLKAHYPQPKAALVPVLRAVQAELGWLSPETQAWVAAFLGVTPLEVHEVVSFYPMLYDKPVGRHVIHVCRTLSCDACGGKELFEHLRRKLGVERGGTTADGRYTLKAAECLASCGTAPVVLIDNERHENLSLEQVDRLLEAAQ
ncbi:MAG TPA: NADH-quinone oxidoreductase subunit NuoE [Planctomycetota bacterium]|nr:NADH-quinone oxidoreductase subunit NuoE [Planctomycetota bacterium]